MSVKIDGASDFLYTLTEPVASTPFTISCWFKLTSVVDNQIIVAIDTPDTSGYRILGAVEASGGVASDPVRAYNYNGSSFGVAVSTSGYSADVWTHGCGVFTNDTSRDAFIRGGSKGSNTSNIVGIPSELIIGRRRRNNGVGQVQTTSYLAEVAIWSVALNDANVVLLASGTDPSTVDAGNLVAYWPLVDDAADDIGFNDLIESNITFDIDHPSIGEDSLAFPETRPAGYDPGFYWDEIDDEWNSDRLTQPGSYVEYVVVISEEGNIYFRAVT